MIHENCKINEEVPAVTDDQRDREEVKEVAQQLNLTLPGVTMLQLATTLQRRIGETLQEVRRLETA